MEAHPHPLTLLPVGYTDPSSLGTLALSSLIGDYGHQKGVPSSPRRNAKSAGRERNMTGRT